MTGPFSRRQFLVQGMHRAAGVTAAGTLLAAVPSTSAEKAIAPASVPSSPGDGWFADSLFNLLVDYYPEEPVLRDDQLREIDRLVARATQSG